MAEQLEPRLADFLRATSPRFDTIRLGMGLGLGGQVAEAMAPRWTGVFPLKWPLQLS
ncbi:hypothetical protein G6030_07660, partial [Dietzia sp. E1]|nr:hypothetical protein [Dietzia sp. E1]